jgi:protoporphyrin/coproporphyrin ferrochelatase
MTAAGGLAARTAVLLVSHGTVDDLNDLGAFLTTVRRGRPAPPELVEEMRRRYQAIGGSPLNAINAKLADKLARRLGGEIPVAAANRLWRPFVRDALGSLAAQGVEHVVVVPLAQHSSHVYSDDARRAAEGSRVTLACAPSWGDREDLCSAFARRITVALEASKDRAKTTVVMTAHSLPRAIIDGGDPYEKEFRAAAAAVQAVLRAGARLGATDTSARPYLDVAFQSQGLAGHGAWLGPDLRAALDAVRARGDRHVVFAPIGFLADHVEILYDLDVEARAMADERGLSYARAASLNADDDFVDVLASVARPFLAAQGAPRHD